MKRASPSARMKLSFGAWRGCTGNGLQEFELLLEEAMVARVIIVGASEADQQNKVAGGFCLNDAQK